ncbi:MAG: ABC transporter substrate-binding protein [Hyphomicrobiales bacterium]|nr:ABC transporter substrate-binding protein [Hyphomicrobiales bacterium]
MDDRDDISRRDGPAPTRRALIGGAAAAGVLFATGGARAQTPRRGGDLRLALSGGGPTDTLSPLDPLNAAKTAAMLALYDRLAEEGPDGTPTPSLARSFEAKPGALVWTLTLHKDATFSDGRAFGADDAIASLNLHRGKTASPLAPRLGDVKEIKKLGPDRIEIALAAPDADFPAVLADPRAIMLPAGHRDFAAPVGTGPYALETFEPGVRIALKRKASHWNAARGFVETATIAPTADAASRVAALLGDLADAIDAMPADAIAKVKAAAGRALVRASGGFCPEIALRVDRAPFDDPDLRRALKHVVDREALLAGPFGGLGTLAADHPVAPYDPFHAKDVRPLAHDPARAAALIKKLGAAPAFAIHASDAAFPEAPAFAAALAEAANAAGAKASVRAEPAPRYWDRVWLHAGCAASRWEGGWPATHALAALYQSGAPWNETRWSNPKFDGLLAAARAELDPAKRRQPIHDMQAMLRDDGGSIVPLTRDWADAHGPKLMGLRPHHVRGLDGGRIVSTCWLAG